MNDQLIIPIYVDTNALLDLLASIEGGFSLVEKITTKSSSASSSDRTLSSEAGTEFGIPNVLSLLKLKLGGSLSSTREHQSGEEKEVERIHTYGSLLHRLRMFLTSEKLIRKLENDNDWDQIKPSDFVEIHGVFRPNPMADSLELLDRLIGIVQLIGTGFTQTSPQPQKRKTQARSSGNEIKQMKQIREFLTGIIKDIEQENIKTFVIDMDGELPYRAVAILFTDYLRDKSLTEIAHKEFKLLGKVVRKLEPDSDSSINLLRGTGLGGIGKDTLEQLISAFSQLEGMNLPEVVSEIVGPALEVVPLAVYV